MAEQLGFYFDDDEVVEEEQMSLYMFDELVRLYRVEGIARPEAGKLGVQFNHVTLARNSQEARDKVAYKIPPFATIQRVYAVN